jgi:CAAX protease family protein
VEARRNILTFLSLTVALCLPFYYRILSPKSIETIPDLVVAGIMWAPGVAALFTRFVHQRNIRGFGWRLGPSRYLIVSYLLPLMACLIVYGIVWATALGRFNGTRLTPFWRSIAVAATAGFVWEALLALGEELGWRGLLVPELAKIASFRMTALLSGAIWVLFHVPGIVFAGYHSRAPIWYGLSVFTISFVAVSFVLAWLRLKSGSVWTAVIFHASHNLFIQNVFDRLTVSGPMTQYVTTEFGAGLALLYGCAAVWCWRQRRQLASLSLPPQAVQAK